MKIFQSVIISLFAIILVGCGGNKIESGNEFLQTELPDGTVVSLNKNSSLQFDESFQTREVKLEGEAFFDVTPGDSQFKVITEQGEVTVLGTEFNVKSTDDELEVEVEEGEVELKAEGENTRLGKGKTARYTKGNGLKSGNAEFKYRKWMGDLQREFKSVGKEFKKASREVSKDGKKLGRELKKAIKEGEKKLKD